MGRPLGCPRYRRMANTCCSTAGGCQVRVLQEGLTEGKRNLHRSGGRKPPLRCGRSGKCYSWGVSVLASRNGNHNENCAKAVGHACACSGCGGSLHGWEGWLGLAKGDVRDRQVKKEKIAIKWEKYYCLFKER